MITQNYEKSGVSIQAGEELVENIKRINPNIGGFAGLYKLNDTQSLVACTDGVGTKLELGIAADRLEDLGQDLVAMSVNDLIVCGAQPLFFLDYYATGKLNVPNAGRVIKGIAQACEQSSCVLLGGETAEMPGFYTPPKFDVAGFAVGIVQNDEIIDGSDIQEGDLIVALPSSGFHSNGFSLIRKIMADNNLTINSKFQNKTLGDFLCEPTKLYVQTILKLKKNIRINGMAHITGGGLTNIARVIPQGLKYSINVNNISVPEIFSFFKKIGNISTEEAFTVWNMGIGFVIIINPIEYVKMTEIFSDLMLIGSIVSTQ